MLEWKLIRLGDICLTNKSSYSSKDNWKFVNYLDTGSLTENKITELQYINIEMDKMPSRARRKVIKNSILYSTVRPNQLHYGIIKEPVDNLLVSTGFTVIDVDTNKAIPEFIYYLLTQNNTTEQLQAIAEQSVSTYPSIKPSDIENLEFKLPNLIIQSKIVSILDTIDSKIRQNEKINNNLEQQTQAIYSRMFIEHRQESWSTGQLSDLISVKYGKDHKKLADGNYPVYGSGGIIRYVEKPLHTGESVLIPRKGTLNNVIYVNEAFWSVDTMFYTEMLHPNIAKFVYHFVKSKDLASLNAGSAVPSMTTNILNAMQLYIPDEKTLEKFENIVSPMYSAMQENTKESKILANTRDTLLPKLMSGELDVSDIDL
jgi:type I restriction enzyme S subunit